MTLYEHILVATGENLHKTYSSHIFPRSDHFDRSDRTWSIKYRYVIWVTCGYTQKKVLFLFSKLLGQTWVNGVEMWMFTVLFPKIAECSHSLYMFAVVCTAMAMYYVSTYNVITGISGHSCTNLPSLALPSDYRRWQRRNTTFVLALEREDEVWCRQRTRRWAHGFDMARVRFSAGQNRRYSRVRKIDCWERGWNAYVSNLHDADIYYPAKSYFSSMCWP